MFLRRERKESGTAVRKKIQNKIMAMVITICLFSMLSMSLAFFMTEKSLSEHSKEVNMTLADNAAAGGREALISAAHYFLRIIAREQSYNCNNMLNAIKFNVRLLEAVLQDIFNNQSLYTGSRPVVRPSEAVEGIYAVTYSLPASVPMTEEIRREIDLLSNMNMLMPMLAENPYILELYVGTTSGLLYNYTTATLENPEFDPRSRPWYIQALENPGDVIFTEVYEDAFGTGLVITAAKAVFDDRGKLIGVAALDLLLKDLKALVAETRVTNSGYVFIINSEGRYIVHPDMGRDDFEPFITEAKTGELAEGYRRMMNGEEGFLRGLSKDGVRVFMIFSPISVAGWSIGVMVYEGEFLSPILPLAAQLNDYAAASEEKIVSMSARSRFVVGVNLVAVVVMVMLLSVFMTRVISAPIRKLAGEVVRIGEGDFTYRIPVESHDEIGFLTEAFNEMADNLYNHAQDIVALNSEKTRLMSAANTDALTRIYNRRYFMENAAEMVESALKSGAGAQVALFDLDHFKKINDTYGHQAGDKVLVEVAALVNRSIRGKDLFARYGGEEFILLLMDVSKTTAREIVERIRKNISRSPVNFEDGQIPVSASFGVASVSPGTDLAGLVAFADQALYKAKEGGRNLTVFYDGEAP